ncbi:MAG: hypothetical protein SFU86_16960 [Pirellulaceae bacterium]|nr:hypothetical protein [Pirellulaceae bacterium]
MPLRIKCPTGHTLIVPDDRAGRTLRCPRCGEAVVVPGGEGQAAPREVALPEAKRVGTTATVTASTVAKVASAAPIKNRPPPPARPVVKPKSRALPPREPASPVVSDAPQPAAFAGGTPIESAPPLAMPVDLPVATFAPEPPPIVSLAPSPAAPPFPPLPTAEPVVEAPPPIVPPAPRDNPPAIDPSTIEPPAAVLEDGAPPAVAAEVIPPVESPPEPPPALAPAAPPVESPGSEIEEHAASEAPPPPLPAAPAPAGPAPVTISLAADTAKVLVVYQLAAALVVAALFSLAPAVWDVVEYVQFLDAVDAPSVARWALVLFFLGVVQLAYAVYLFQLPDWTSVWVVTMYSLLMAAIYAGTLGLVLISGADGWIVGEHGLQLADKLAGGKAALWCLCMVSVSTILAFFAGRLSVRWRRAEMMLREAGV